MQILKNINILEKELRNILTEIHYNDVPEVYVSITGIMCRYDNDCEDSNGDLDLIEIEINWGRYYEDEEKEYLNENYDDTLFVDIRYIDNYDYIKGLFAQILINR